MFAYAQHIKSNKGQEGVNSYLTETRELKRVYKKHVEVVPPSGNSVESYLDLEYSPGTSRSQIEALLIALEMVVSQGQSEVELVYGPARAKFFAVQRYLGSARDQEFQILKRHVLDRVLESGSLEGILQV